eukprot:gene5717-4079_t
MTASEKELITLGLGNYATLIAAQWANSTSDFDVHHHTLYTERQASSVVGGTATSGRVRVPRLLLLDAPHAVRVEGLQEMAQREAEAPQSDENADNGEGSETLLGGGGVPEIVPGDGGLYQDPNMSLLATRLVQRKPWEWRAAAGYDDEEAGEDDDSDEEEEAAAAHHRRRRRQRRVDFTDRWYTRHTNPSEGVEEQAEEEEEAEKAADPARQLERTKRRLFQQQDHVVPWWHYISTGLCVDAVTTLRPPQQADATSNVPAAHSYGFGLAHLRPDSGACPEMEVFQDSLRRQTEDADALQGLQLFLDADSMFGGAAHNVLQAFWDDAGSKTPAVVIAAFQPLPACLTDPAEQRTTPFAAVRREERVLNRLLATSHLSQHSAAVYIPLELENWGEFFSLAGRRDRPQWLRDDRATAQYIAAVTDTALYGARDGGNPRAPGAVGAEEEVGDIKGLNAGSAGPPPAVGQSNGPAYTLLEWSRTVRPSASLRVASMFGALPLQLQEPGEGGQPRDLWRLMEATPLLGTEAAEATTAVQSRGQEDPTPAAPDTRRSEAGRFVPLTHRMTCSPLEEKGRIMGHAASLRGAGLLPSAIYPAREAMLRYALPLRSSTYLPLLTRTNLPISSTFPLSLLFPEPLPAGISDATVRSGLNGVDIGAHVVNTYASAGMLHSTLEAARRILSPRFHSTTRHKHQSLYQLADDDWNEVLEDVAEMHDDYHHESFDNDDDDDDDDDY